MGAPGRIRDRKMILLSSRKRWKTAFPIGYAEIASRNGSGAAFDLHFPAHPANINAWTFGLVVVTVCRLARNR
jgi:hypothetical protein